MSHYTYASRATAHYGNELVIVPDQVADNQAAYDGKLLAARRIHPWTQEATEVMPLYLRGDLYGLGTDAQGSPRVSSVLPYTSEGRAYLADAEALYDRLRANQDPIASLPADNFLFRPLTDTLL